MSRCTHEEVVPGRKPGTERCKACSWVFPCRSNDCGHIECIDFRGELPICHFCRKRVKGSPASIRSVTATMPELQNWDDDGTWTPWSVRGVTRAVHYVCRDQVDAGVNLEQDGSEQVQEDQEAIA